MEPNEGVNKGFITSWPVSCPCTHLRLQLVRITTLMLIKTYWRRALVPYHSANKGCTYKDSQFTQTLWIIYSVPCVWCCQAFAFCIAPLGLTLFSVFLTKFCLCLGYTVSASHDHCLFFHTAFDHHFGSVCQCALCLSFIYMTEYFSNHMDVVKERRHADQHYTNVTVPKPGLIWFQALERKRPPEFFEGHEGLVLQRPTWWQMGRPSLHSSHKRLTGQPLLQSPFERPAGQPAFL